MGDRQDTESPSSSAVASRSVPAPRSAGKRGADGESSSGRISHPIDDISADEALIRYAVAAQLARLKALDISHAQVASVLKIHPSNLAHILAGDQTISIEMLHALDRACVAFAPGLDHTAGLAQFGVRHRALLQRESLLVSVQPSYFIATHARSEDELHVMSQAADLLDKFLINEKAKRPISGVTTYYKGAIRDVVERLILIAGAPPTPRSVEAQILLGSLAKYAFDITMGQLEDSLRNRALGFRVWRAFTKMLLLSRDDKDQNARRLAVMLRPRVASLLSEAEELRKDSIYPGRSLDLELAIAVPHKEFRPIVSATGVLRARAVNPYVTLRERGTAAHGVWQRAMAAGLENEDADLAEMARIITSFAEAEEKRSDIASGLRWVTTTLDYVVRTRTEVCNDWEATKVDEPWFDAVSEAAKMLDQEDIPEHIRRGTTKLFQHMLLQNGDVERRKAIDAVAAGGYVAPVSRALGRVLRDPRTDSWMRIRASFALGFMQYRSDATARSLISACRDVCDAIHATRQPVESQVHELHAILFAIGDCYGVIGGEDDARAVRDTLHDQLVRLVDDKRLAQEPMFLIARALVYMLTFTAQPRNRGAQDLSQELLEKLQTHPDRITSEFSKWALGFRFSEDGETIHPVLHAA